MKKKSGGSVNGLIVILLLVFVGATEYGYSPGQKLLELTSSLIQLALGSNSAVAVAPNEKQVFRVTRLSRQDFESTYGKFKLAPPSGSNVQRFSIDSSTGKLTTVSEPNILRSLPKTASNSIPNSTAASVGEKKATSPKASAAEISAGVESASPAVDAAPASVDSQLAAAQNEAQPAAPRPETPPAKPAPDSPAPSFSLR